VDKTNFAHKLITEGKYYFLSRPRRFGKSLLLDTFYQIFTGNRELFKDFAIYDKDWEWKAYPIIKINFSEKKTEEPDDLKNFIINQLDLIAGIHDTKLTIPSYDERFNELILKITNKFNSQVVVLIDEYDKPIIDHLENPALASEFREILKGFYTIIKAQDANIKFAFLTGVSKFSKTGIFSGLNNLRDITMEKDFSAICGITQKELLTNLKEHIRHFSIAENLSEDELTDKIALMYNGYCFSDKCESVYNPFSTLTLFVKQHFSNYWFESGTPTFLIKLIKNQRQIPQDIEDIWVNEYAFGSYEIETLDLIPILFQAGYLTIKDYKSQRRQYLLSYPNLEVKESFQHYLINTFSGVKKELSDSYLWNIVDALDVPDFDRFFEMLSVFFANIPYDIQIPQEKYYQSIFYLIFSLLGLKITAEARTSKGRIDAVIEEKAIFIFEFKYSGTKEEALQQIKNKEYFKPYLAKGKDIYIIGATFKDKDQFEWVVERV
jgi:hypothetical protein